MDQRDKTRCPYCGEEILAVAVKCKHCGTMLNSAPSAPGITGSTEADRLDRNLNGLLWVLLIGSVACILYLLVTNPGPDAARLFIATFWGAKPYALDCLNPLLLTYCRYGGAGFLAVGGTVYNNYFVLYIGLAILIVPPITAYTCFKLLFMSRDQQEKLGKTEAKFGKMFDFLFSLKMVGLAFLVFAAFLYFWPTIVKMVG